MYSSKILCAAGPACKIRIIGGVRWNSHTVGLATFRGLLHRYDLSCSIHPRIWLSSISLETMDSTSSRSTGGFPAAVTFPVTVTLWRSYFFSSLVSPQTEYCFSVVINPHCDESLGHINVSLGTSAGHSSHRQSSTSRIPVTVTELLAEAGALPTDLAFASFWSRACPEAR